MRTKIYVITAIIGIVLIGGIAAGLIIQNSSKTNAQCSFITQQKIDDVTLSKEQLSLKINSLTQEIRNMLKKTKINNINLQKILQERKEYMAKAMTLQSIDIGQYFFSEQEQKRIPESCREKREIVKGILKIIHADLENNKYKDENYLKLTNNSKLSLYSINDYGKTFRSSSALTVNGIKMDNLLLINGGNDQKYNKYFGSVTQETSPPSVQTMGEKKIAVLLVSFQDKKNPLPKEIINEAVFVNMNQYYKSNSYNQIELGGDVIDNITINESQNCNEEYAMNEAKRIAAQSIDMESYDYFIIIAPFPKCGWIGKSNLGDDTAIIDSSSIKGKNDWGTIGHEFGHCLGVHHATRYNEKNIPNAEVESSEESYSEYGDNWDIMGDSTYKMQFSSVHKESLGWMNDSYQLYTVSKNGIYTINQLDSLEQGIKALRIQRSDDTYLYIDYRKPNYFEKDIIYGLTLHTTFSDIPIKTLLLNNPNAPVNSAAILKPGEQIEDPATKTIIKIQNFGNQASLEIQLGKTDFTPPSVSILSDSFDTVLSVDQSATFTVTTSDDSGINKVEYYYWPSEWHMLQDELPRLFATSTTDPYQVTVPATSLSHGEIYIFARAYDKAGEAFNVENNFNDSEVRSMYVDLY